MLLIIGCASACRREELANTVVDDVEDKGTMLFINIPKTKTNLSRSFIVNLERDLTFYRKYLKLRPPHTKHRRLFVFYGKGVYTQVMGIHTLGYAAEK